MKITKRQLKQIIKEELVMETEGSPEQELQSIADSLSDAALNAKEAPSHVPASDFYKFLSEMAEKVNGVLNMMDDAAGRNPGGSIGE